MRVILEINSLLVRMKKDLWQCHPPVQWGKVHTVSYINNSLAYIMYLLF